MKFIRWIDSLIETIYIGRNRKIMNAIYEAGAEPVYRTKSGKILTHEDIQKLADEAERGYDVSQLKEKGNSHLTGGPDPQGPEWTGLLG